MANPPERSRVEVAIGVIQHDGRFLICQRPDHVPLPGLWEFPGGKCEAGESPKSCLARELHEELGITITAPQPLPVLEHDYDYARVRLHPFLCHLAGGTPQPHAARQLRWITLAQFPAHRFPPANTPLLAHLLMLFTAPTPAPD